MQAADSLLLTPVEISNIIDIVCATWQPGLGGNTNKQSVCWELLWFFGLVFLRAFFSPPFSLITFIASPSFHACKYLHLGRVVFCAACISQWLLTLVFWLFKSGNQDFYFEVVRCNHRREYAVLKYCTCIQRILVSDLAVAGDLPSGNWSDKELKCVNGCWQTWVLLVSCQVLSHYSMGIVCLQYGVLNPNKAVDSNM